MDTFVTLREGAGRVFDDETASEFHGRGQAGGHCVVAVQWPAADADRGRVGHSAVDAAQLAQRCRGACGGVSRPDTQATLPQAGSPGDQSAEIARLRREVERLRMERDILKKTVAIFSEPPK